MGLTFETERSMLLAARELEAAHAVTVATTLLAAHALPPEYAGRADEYIDLVGADWLPRLAAESSAHGRPLVECVDAFCEEIAFSAAQCDRLFTRAAELGLPVRLHAEQLANIGGSRVAARHGALSVEHMEFTSEPDVMALAAAGTVAVLLPVAYYALARATAATDRTPAPAPRADRDRERCQPRFGARRLAAAGDEHGTPPVRAHRCRGAGGRHLQRGACTRHACDARHARPGHDRGFRHLVDRHARRLGYWIGFNPCNSVVRNGACVLERRP
jgi:hypothetical protein